MRVRHAAMFAAAILTCRADVISDTLNALNSGDFARAESVVRADQMARGVTPETLEAESWIARANQMTKRDQAAETEAKNVLAQYDREFARRGVDSDPHLATALGAAIEVHAQALAAQGQRAAALAFLRTEFTRFATTSIAARIRKNINMLALVGHTAPAIEASQWIGARPSSLAQLRGRPVLLFFWAHWCGDCKGDEPLIAQIARDYASKGLAVIGPTQLYGYTPQNESAPATEELAWTERVFNRFYADIPGISVPVSPAAFRAYGASTTPTIVLIDRRGIVRLYHPGAMTAAELKPEVDRVVSESGREHAAHASAGGQ